MKLPEIKGFMDFSLVDWDGKASAVIFLPFCNFQCPFCYNTTLVLRPETMQRIPYNEIARYLSKNRSWLDGVAITGGEPTIHKELPNLCKRIKKLDLSVKLDTNGSNSAMMKKLIAQEFVDYVALDVKAPLTLERYSAVIGINAENLLPEIEETIRMLLQGSVDYEFRTTLVPTLHRKEDIEEICHKIIGCKKYFLQNFKGDVETLDPKYMNFKPFSSTCIQEFLKDARRLVPTAFLR
ncbi:MAG: anaerobic ribonucleoside-triphosphate reductase activating protein [Candidatus Bathyarchaeota archaeon]|nr:MAG: anaerobic ribonucleoside-triphosphate reductase activating protein [Candidatus Bathyarchaeota archaeon]